MEKQNLLLWTTSSNELLENILARRSERLRSLMNIENKDLIGLKSDEMKPRLKMNKELLDKTIKKY